MWFGRIPDSDDNNGNELDCLMLSPEQALKCLQEQLAQYPMPEETNNNL